MIYLKSVEDLDISLISDILEIDSAVYPEHLQGTFDELYDRFKANRDMFILLYDDTRLVGYFCLFPIRNELYEEISNSDRLYDSDISGDQLEQYKPGNTYKLYAISTAIHPDYQGKGLSKHLINGFYKYLLDKKKRSIHISSVLATAVTNGGDSILRKLGFTHKKALSSGYSLYELSVDNAYCALIESLLK